jgi:hypothetical protein
MRKNRPSNPNFIHSTPHTNRNTCNNTLQIIVGFSADQLVPVTLTVYTSAGMKPSFTVEQNECGVCFSSVHTIKVSVHKICL